MSEDAQVTPEPVKPKRTRKGVVEAGVPAEAWHRVHPITPVLNGWQVIAVIIAFILFQNVEELLRLQELMQSGNLGSILLLGLGIFVGVLAVIMIYAYLTWRAMTYAVTDQAVWLREGILFRKQRHVRLERIQAVDVVHPLLGRIFGLGKLSVDAAGGAGSSLAIGYLRDRDLADLRAQILALAAGVELSQRPPEVVDANGSEGVLGMGESSVETPQQARRLEAPENLVYSVPTGRLFVSLLLSVWFVVCVLTLVGLVVGGVIVTVKWGVGAGIALLPAWLPLVIVAVTMAWTRFAREFNFQVAVSPDGLRVRRGLLERRSETIPPRRVHAIRITQPLFWRKPDWYRVEISQAVHRADSSGQSSVSHALLPVGTRDEALKALWLVLPDLGIEDVSEFFTQALQGSKPSEQFVSISSSALLFDPLVRYRRAVATTQTCVVVRDGWMTRTASFAAYERIQSVATFTGPWAARRGLQGIRAALVPGPVALSIAHLSFEDAATVAAFIVARCDISRASEPPERWFARVQEQGMEEQEQSQ